MRWLWFVLGVICFLGLVLAAMPGMIPPWADIVMNSIILLLVVIQVFGYLLSAPHEQNVSWRDRVPGIKWALGPAFYPSIALLLLIPIAMLIVGAQLRCSVTTDCGEPLGDMASTMRNLTSLPAYMILTVAIILAAHHSLVDWSAVRSNLQGNGNPDGDLDRPDGDRQDWDRQDVGRYRMPERSSEGAYLAGAFALWLVGFLPLILGPAGLVSEFLERRHALFLIVGGFVLVGASNLILTWRLLRRTARS